MDKATALFRNLPAWDKDFRRVAWGFFKAALRPDLSSPDTLEVVEASRRQPPPPFQFSLYDDGCPILVNTEDGETIKNPRRRDAMREYMKLHYSTSGFHILRNHRTLSMSLQVSPLGARNVRHPGTHSTRTRPSFSLQARCRSVSSSRTRAT